METQKTERDLGLVDIDFFINVINKIVELYEQGAWVFDNNLSRITFDTFSVQWGYYEWRDERGNPCSNYKLTEKFKVDAGEWEIELAYTSYRNKMSAINKHRDPKRESVFGTVTAVLPAYTPNRD